QNLQAMMKPLRKRHLLVWRMLAILLPAAIIIASLSVPKEQTQKLIQPADITPLPVILKTTQKDNYTVSIRATSDQSQLQLEWINKTVLQYPTATIYAGSEIKNFKEAKLIGRIEARGAWYFPLDSSFKNGPGGTDHFVLYDFIHQQVIDTINFKP
ncbi:MAG: hypothetical protein ABUT20_48635, partial [Bacteroidota bacterium]